MLRGFLFLKQHNKQKERNERKMKAIYDLKGRKFGTLLVIRRIGKDNQGNILWQCKCLKCGNPRHIVRSTQLNNGQVTSCGMCEMRLRGQKLGRKIRRDRWLTNTGDTSK